MAQEIEGTGLHVDRLASMNELMAVGVQFVLTEAIPVSHNAGSLSPVLVRPATVSRTTAAIEP
jgi:hypothetical protein